MTEENTVPVQPTTQSTPKNENSTTKTEKKSNKTLWFILGGCFGLICLCCLCFTAMTFGSVGLVFQGLDDLSADVVAICDASPSELERIYDDAFSSEYKRGTSFAEFETFYNQNSDFFTSTCADVENLSFSDIANIDFSIVNDDAQLEWTTDNGVLYLEASQQTNGDWKIDDIRIT